MFTDMRKLMMQSKRTSVQDTMNSCDRTLINNKVLKWGNILDVEILCLQV